MIILAGIVAALLVCCGIGYKLKTSYDLKHALKRSGACDLPIVKTSRYQSSLFRLAGGKCFDGVHVRTVAQLIFETHNSDDKAVRVEIQGHTVGYLSALNAQLFRVKHRKGGSCPALIMGGWQRDREQGDFTVYLDFDLH